MEKSPFAKYGYWDGGEWGGGGSGVGCGKQITSSPYSQNLTQLSSLSLAQLSSNLF